MQQTYSRAAGRLAKQGRRTAAAATLVWTCAAAGADVSPKSVEADIARLGAKQEVARVTAGDGRRWETVMGGVSSGRKEWLDLVLPLKEGADAGPGEELRDSFATALLKNPAGVLELVPAAYPLADVCFVPLIEPTDRQVSDYKRRALKALDAVPAPSRPASADACRKAIADAR